MKVEGLVARKEGGWGAKRPGPRVGRRRLLLRLKLEPPARMTDHIPQAGVSLTHTTHP